MLAGELGIVTNPSFLVVTVKFLGETHRFLVIVLNRSSFSKYILSNYPVSNVTFVLILSPIRSCSVIGLNWKP